MASFGEKLRQQREMRGVSLREIAEGTKISVRFLQALEEDRVEILPGGLFPRAFVKQYATFLGLDADRLVAEFVADVGATQPERPPARFSMPRLTLGSGQVFLGVVALVAIALTLRRSASEDRRDTARPASAPRPVAAAPAVLPTDRVYPSPTALAQAAAPADSGLVLSMTAEQECWVEVRADGETVINRVLTAGESQRLEAHGQIVLSVGNAGALRIRVNDRPGLPLGRSGEVRRNIVITRQSLPSLVDDRAAAGDGRSS